MTNRLKLKTHSKKLFYWLRYVFCMATILLTIDYALFLHYKTKLLPAPLTQELPNDQKLTDLQRMLWRLNFDKKSSYVNFDMKKSPDSIRIGCFGDSFTRGDEVNERYDYPSFLQGLFQKNGYENVEILNFGMGWYGFHQAFILWENVGRQYELDAVLLGPQAFHKRRDLSFNHSFSYSPVQGDVHYFHSRYILKGNTVERIDPIGETITERIDNYWKFIPHLQYLRYDSNPPAFLTAPAACLLPNRKLKANPFYYKKDRDREVNTIYRILLSRIADQTPRVFLTDYREQEVQLAGSIEKDNVAATLFYQPVHFPYLAFTAHNGPCGNALLAQQMFDFLTQKEESVLSLIETEDIEREAIEQVRLKKTDLSEYKDIAVEINGVKLGRFYDSYAIWEMYCKGSSCEREKNTFEDTVSLIMLKNAGDESLLEAVFMPVDFEIREDASVTIQVTHHSRVREYALGKVSLLNPGLNIGVIDLGKTLADCIRKNIHIEGSDFLWKGLGNIQKNDAVAIFVDQVLILSGKVGKQDEKFVLNFFHQRYFTIRADGREFLDIEQLDPTGIVYLALSIKEDETIRIPLARWLKIRKTVPLTRGQPQFKGLFKADP